jgi:hypothetical protein
VTAVPAAVTRAVLADEVSAVAAWATRQKGWEAQTDMDGLRLSARTTHPATGIPLRIDADLDGYPGFPPAWRFVDPSTGQPLPQAFPRGGAIPGISGSIFHSNRVVCAPWNRLAYAEHGGPHGDWGALTNWKSAAPTYTKADTLADMLSQIALHLSASPGMHP